MRSPPPGTPLRLGVLLALLLCLQAPGGPSPAGAQESNRRAPVADEAAGAAETAAVPEGLTPLIGDFDGDRRSDVFWYGPGGLGDHLWLGRPDRAFVGSPATVGRGYVPLVGDWNGDRSRDILWYGPGADPDVLWFGHPDGRFTGRAVDVAGNYQPFTGDFDADGRRDIFWYGPGTGYDVVWYGRPDSRFGAVAATVRGTYRPWVGDFGGDGPSDVFWYAPGGADDILWFGHGNRRFTSRATTIDIGHVRAVPLRPETIANQYDPYGFVAHAFGAIDGHGYTNSLEAFQRNYGRGFRVFEVDLVRLADGTALAAHDGLEANYGLSKSFRDATWADLAGRRYLDRYTILRSQDLVRLLTEHPDAYMILDSKWDRVEIYRTILRQAPQRGLRERILPHVEDQTELNAFRTAYPLQSYVVALYHTQYRNLFDDPQVIDFTRRNRTPAVMMWWRDRDFSLTLAGNSRERRRFSRPFADALKAAGAVAHVHSLGDPNEIQRFWDLRVGVYSDNPFPPLDGTAALRQDEELILPRFPEGVIPA